MVSRSIRSILGGGNLDGPRSAPLAPLGPCERAEGAFSMCVKGTSAWGEQASTTGGGTHEQLV